MHSGKSDCNQDFRYLQLRLCISLGLLFIKACIKILLHTGKIYFPFELIAAILLATNLATLRHMPKKKFSEEKKEEWEYQIFTNAGFLIGVVFALVSWCIQLLPV